MNAFTPFQGSATMARLHKMGLNSRLGDGSLPSADCVREVLLVDMDNKAFLLEPCAGIYSLYIYTYTVCTHIDTQLGDGLRARSSARGHGQQGVCAGALHGYIFTIYIYTHYTHRHGYIFTIYIYTHYTHRHTARKRIACAKFCSWTWTTRRFCSSPARVHIHYTHTHTVYTHTNIQLGNGLRMRSSARGHGQQGVSA